MVLSLEEKITIATYDRVAAGRREVVNNAPFNPNFWLPEARKLLRLGLHGRFLDIGCGDARHAWPFRQDGNFQYVGVDLSEGMLTEARLHNPGANFARMDLFNLGFADETFDCFWAVASLFHCRKSKAPDGLKEIKRVLKPGGFGFISVKEGDGEKMVGDQTKDGQRLFAYYSLLEFWKTLRSNGFRVLECSRDLREYNPPRCDNIWLLYFVQKV